MSYAVVLPRPVKSRIGSLGLPDFLKSPIDGMAYGFEMVDPTNRLCTHAFLFPVVYAADEERLIVGMPLSVRRVG